MTDPPRHLPPTPEERLRTVVSRMAGGSNAGSTRHARPVKPSCTHGPTGWLGQVEVGDTTGQTDAIAITSTTGSGDGSTASGLQAISIGKGSNSAGYGTIAIGPGANADGGADPSNLGAAAFGQGSNASGTQNLSLGAAAKTVGEFGLIACGPQTEIYGDGSVGLGRAVHVGTSIAPVTNGIGIGTGVTVTVDNEFRLGNGNNIVIVDGDLVLNDGHGALWRLDVTGGALTLVAYP